ncbi:hypothetical protein JHK82_056632 [Glycine max]|uniref:Uncharacterized protein n=1 Tax=Glycine max TaxID=3847 RepID=A0A0R0ENI7_SOYBN|nr:hypothetical protein JHK86_056467 [Glycine max]KAG4910612.1 hypothetical protein JHK87_056728 [Glycine soja]KAG4919192.1 hypothetical protein JHK85_057473 [Glycine max]KAG5075272.1 hypothetical protein JHK84_056503 [Glycine max]KAG5077937.1 hypothetical protein JHK82_056632 [Glycine max]
MFHLSGTDNPIIGTFSNFFYSNLSLHLFSFFKILHIITTRSCGVHSRIRGVEISQVATRSTTPNGGIDLGEIAVSLRKARESEREGRKEKGRDAASEIASDNEMRQRSTTWRHP